jgi:speckle-type POZ protein
MSDQQANKETLPSQGSIVWCKTQTEVVQLKFQWTFQQFEFLKSFGSWGSYRSSAFSHEKTPTSKWILHLSDVGSNMHVNLDMPHPNLSFNCYPIRVKIAILNKKREQIFPQQQCLPQFAKLPYSVFNIKKQMLIESECFVNGKLTICCEIESFFIKSPALSNKPSTVADFHEKRFNNTDKLIAQLEGLFENMKFSDITVNVRGREFQAHKSILAIRSAFFAVMFEHPTKENLTNRIEVEDVEPAVFNEILRFLYTGKVSESAMDKMSARILAVADKYLLDELKMECETQLIHRMSAENCLELLLITDEHHTAFYLRKYAVKFFRNFSNEVMATDDWEKAEQEDPQKCFSLMKELVKSLV